MGAYEVNTAGIRAAAMQIDTASVRIGLLAPLPDLHGAGEFHDLLNAIEDFQADWNPAIRRLFQTIKTLSTNTSSVASIYDSGDAERSVMLGAFDGVSSQATFGDLGGGFGGSFSSGFAQ